MFHTTNTFFALLLAAAVLSTTHANWVLSTELKSPIKEELFGASIVLTEKFLAVGAPFDNTEYGETDSGTVRIYGRPDRQTFVQDRTIEGSLKGETLGYSLDMSTDSKTLVIGAPANDGDTTERPGLVRVFRYDNKDWKQAGPDIEGRNSQEKFGQSVRISDDGKVVCIAAGRSGAADEQRVDVYRVDGEDFDKFEFVGEILIPDYHENLDTFISHVDIVQNGDLGEYFIAVSSPRYEDGKGIVQVFVLDDRGVDFDWVMVAKPIDGKKDHDELGKSISLGYSDNFLYVAVGIPSYSFVWGEDSKRGSNGRVEVYRVDVSKVDRNNLGEWELIESISQLDEDDGTGESVAISRDGQRLAVASPKFEDYKGTVRVFDFVKEDAKFYIVGEEFFAGDEDFDGFGSALSLSGLDLAIGANFGDYVRLYRYDDTIKDDDDDDGDDRRGSSTFVKFLSVFLIAVGIGAVLFAVFTVGQRMGWRLPIRQVHTPVSTDTNVDIPHDGRESGSTNKLPFPLRPSSGRESNLSARMDGEVLHGMPSGLVSMEDEDGQYEYEMKQIT